MMRRSYFFLFIFSAVWLIGLMIYGTESVPKHFDTSLEMGNVEVSEDLLSFREETFPIYKVEALSYIPLTTLTQLGITFKEQEHILYMEERTGMPMQEDAGFFKPYNEQAQQVYLSDYKIAFDALQSYSIRVGECVMVPLESLKCVFDLEKVGNTYKVSSKLYQELNALEVGSEAIYNVSDYNLYFDYIDMYWDGENFIDLCFKDQILYPHSEQPLELQAQIEDKPVVYLSTYIERVQDMERPSPEFYGQRPTQLYKNYTKAKRIQSLEKVFPKLKVSVKLNYNVAGFNAGEEAQLWRSEKGQYHVLIDKAGKKVLVPSGSVTILGCNGQGWKEATQKEMEDYVNLKDYESETDYLLWTDLFRQRTYAFQGGKNNWELIKVMRCSTGKDKSLTPSGTFNIEYKMPFFGMDKGYRCKNASVIFRDYMYHSILFDRTGKYVKSGLYQLGSRVSHGCIRLSEEDSAWIYKNIPEKTKVYIE